MDQLNNYELSRIPHLLSITEAPARMDNGLIASIATNQVLYRDWSWLILDSQQKINLIIYIQKS